jgi:hypothetical protein
MFIRFLSLGSVGFVMAFRIRDLLKLLALLTLLPFTTGGVKMNAKRQHQQQRRRRDNIRNNSKQMITLRYDTAMVTATTGKQPTTRGQPDRHPPQLPVHHGNHCNLAS